MINIELFSCAGGMSEGFRRAGVTFDYAFDFEEDHCSSYERNLGHRPIRMDVRELLAMIRGGWRVNVGLLVADPPCTPWSRAGKREGIEDERDMLQDTCEIIELLRPQAYLIGNVPGLDDAPNWHIVQKVLAPLAKLGYCVADFAALNAVFYGVPQQRIRPFWFGHLDGPCIQWPAPTHGDPSLMDTLPLPGITPLLPWITCAQALGHLEGAELGRPVRLRHRNSNSDQHGSVADKPARVVGTSNLSDGNVVLDAVDAKGVVTVNGRNHQMSKPGKPSRSITRNTHGDGSILVNDRHAPATADAPSPTVGAKYRGQASQVLVPGKKASRTERIATMDAPSPTVVKSSKTPMRERHKPSELDAPARTVTGSDGGGKKRSLVLKPEVAPMARRRTPRVPQSERVADANRPAPVITAKENRSGSGLAISTLTVEMHHPPSYSDEPAKTVRAGDGQGANRALVLDGSAPTRRKREGSTQGSQYSRIHSVDQPSPTVLTDIDRKTGNGVKLEWPWPRPSTTVQADERMSPPGHHDENWDGGLMSGEGAVILSERAAAILQGFPDGECNGLGDCAAVMVLPTETCTGCGKTRRWHFQGESKKRRWSQIGQAMPPPLSYAVATSVVTQMTKATAARACSGVTARWCPTHGDCTCPRDPDGLSGDMDDDSCPLHSARSNHGDDAAADA